MVEVVGSNHHLPLGNMKDVSSIPSPLNESLHQGSICEPFRKKANDSLEARFLDVGPSFKDEKIVSLHHLTSASTTSIKGMITAKEEDNVKFLIQAKMMRNDVFDAKMKIKRRM